MYIYILYTYSSIFKQTATYYKYVNDANWASSWWFPEMNEYIIFNNLHTYIYICIIIYIYSTIIYIYNYIHWGRCAGITFPPAERRIPKTNCEDAFPEDEWRPEDEFPSRRKEFRRQIPRRRIAPLRRIPLRRRTLKTNSPRKTNCKDEFPEGELRPEDELFPPEDELRRRILRRRIPPPKTIEFAPNRSG